MPDLHQQLREILRNRVCLIGVGNVDLGDDGFGVRLAEALVGEPAAGAIGTETRRGDAGRQRRGEETAEKHAEACTPNGISCVINAGTSPEHFLGWAGEGKFDHLIFLDAVEFGGAPGSVIFLDSAEMATRFPPVSTHKISLGLLAQLVEAGGITKAWLLGVQPQTLRHGAALSPVVQTTLEILVGLLREPWPAAAAGRRLSRWLAATSESADEPLRSGVLSGFLTATETNVC